MSERLVPVVMKVLRGNLWPGDVTAFPASEAAELVGRGVCSYRDPEDAPPEGAPTDKDPEAGGVAGGEGEGSGAPGGGEGDEELGVGEGDGTGGEPANEDPDLSELNVGEAARVIEGLTDSEQLVRLHEREGEGKGRKTVLDALEARFRELEAPRPPEGSPADKALHGPPTAK